VRVKKYHLILELMLPLDSETVVRMEEIFRRHFLYKECRNWAGNGTSRMERDNALLSGIVLISCYSTFSLEKQNSLEFEVDQKRFTGSLEL